MENDKKPKNFIKTTIRGFVNEDMNKENNIRIKEKIIEIMMAETFKAYGRPHGTEYTVIESGDFDKISDSILEILYDR